MSRKEFEDAMEVLLIGLFCGFLTGALFFLLSVVALTPILGFGGGYIGFALWVICTMAGGPLFVLGQVVSRSKRHDG